MEFINTILPTTEIHGVASSSRYLGRMTAIPIFLYRLTVRIHLDASGLFRGNCLHSKFQKPPSPSPRILPQRASLRYQPCWKCP